MAIRKTRQTQPRSSSGTDRVEHFEEHGGTTKCEVCGNEYDKPLEIVQNGISHYFDSFECAISALAPTCEHCNCRIIGHGLEAGGTMFCCAHCAAQSGVTSLKDRS